MNGEPHNDHVAIPTPFLYIPYGPGDLGLRPIADNLGYASHSIRARVLGGRLEILSHPQIEISCEVVNSGAAAATAAVAEFYAGAALHAFNPTRPTDAADVKAAVVLVGRARFIAPPGSRTTVTCPKLLSGGSIFTLARTGMVVQIYDLFTDRLTIPFDALNDRHVARQDDPLPGVGQVWPGRQPIRPPVAPEVTLRPAPS